MLFATVVAGYAATAGASATAEGDAFPPLVLQVADLTGDGVTDVVAGQARASDPRTAVLRFVDGATGRVRWEDTVRDVAGPVEPVTLGGGIRGFLVANHVDDGSVDAAGAHSLGIRLVDADGGVRWTRVFAARTVVPDLFPTYERPALRGVLRGGADLLLIESAARIEAGATRLTRLTALLVDAMTGETVAEHGPFDTVDDDAELRPVPRSDGRDDFAVVTKPAAEIQVADGTLTVYDASTGQARWTADVRVAPDVEVMPLFAGDPPKPVLSVTAYATDGVGVQLLDPETGDVVVDRTSGDFAQVADRDGAARRLRTRYFTDGDGPNGYAVELLDFGGRVVRRAAFRVGKGEGFGVRSGALDEAGDVDGDGWRDLLVHVAYAGGGNPAAYDDRIVFGRTLGSVTVPRNVETLVWTGPGSAAVDGRGDDVYALSPQRADVLDGRTRRPLLRVTSEGRIAVLVGAGGRAARCSDVVVVTYDRDDFALTRVAPHGTVRWTTRPGAIRVRDMSGAAGCPRTRPDRPRDAGRPGVPAIPATGGHPAVAVATACAAAAAFVTRYRGRLG